MSDSLQIVTELQGIRAALDGLKSLKENLDDAKKSANALGDDAAEAMHKIREKSSDTLEVLDRLGTAAFLDDFTDRIKYAGEAWMVMEDNTRSFAVRASAGLSAVSGITGMWVQNLLAASQALAAGAADAERNERAVRTLGRAWDEVRRQTADTVTAAQALAMQQAFVRNGMSTTAEEMGLLTRAAREYALATGTETPAAMQTLTQALQQGDREGLRPFKISVQEGTTRSEAYRQAIHQLRDGMSGSAVSARTFAEENERLSRAWTEMTTTLFSDIARWTDLRSNILGVTQALTALREEGGIHGHADQIRSSTARDTAMLERREYVGRLLQTAAQATNYRGTLINPQRLTPEQLDFIETSLTSRGRTLEDIQGALQFATAAGQNYNASRAATARERTAEAARQQRERDAQLRAQDARDRQDALSPEERRRRALEAAQRAMANDVRRKRKNLSLQLGVPVDDLDSWAENQAAMRLDEENKRREQLVYVREQSEQQAARFRTLSNERTAGYDAYMERTGRAGNLGLQIRNQFGGQRSLEESMAAPIQGAAESVKGAFDSMSSGLASFMDTLIESPERAGEAAAQLAKGVLKGLAMMALQKSLFSTAEGIVALTNPVTAPTAAGFFTAAGIYAGVAVAAGAGAAGIAASQRSAQATPAGSNGSGYNPARVDGGRGGDRNREMPMYTININGSVLDQGGFEDAIVRGIRRANGRGAN